MRLTLLGSGGPVITAERSCSSVLLDADTLIDVGSGSFKNLRRLNVEIDGLKRILITHFHADHISDLIPLLWTFAVEMRRREPLEIFSVRGLRALLEPFVRGTYFPRGLRRFGVVYRVLRGGEGFGDLSTLRTVHNPTNLAYKIRRGGRSVCFSGDTAYFEGLAGFASGCDVLVHDSLFLNRDEGIAATTKHSTAAQAARIARQAGVKTLLLFHVFPQRDGDEKRYVEEAQAEFSGEIILGRDLLTLDL